MNDAFNMSVIVSAIDRATGPIREITQTVGGLEGASRRAAQASQRLASAGAMATGLGAGLGAGLGMALQPAIAFESAMADVGKVVNFDTPAAFAQMGDDILAMSTRIPMAAQGLADIAAAAGQAGIARQELLRFAEDAAKMGVAFDMSGAEAGGAMTGLRTIFALTQDQVVSLGDGINHLANNMDATAGGLLNIMNRAGSTAKLIGFTGEQTAALGAAFLALKTPPEVAATAMDALFTRVATADGQGEKFQAALAGIGMSAGQLKTALADDAQGALLDFLDAVRGSDDVMGTLSDLFGAEYAKHMSKLVGSLDTYRNAVGLVAEETAYAGSMQAEYQARSETTENALQLMQNIMNRLAVTLGSLLLPALNEGLLVLRDLGDRVTAFAKANPEIFRMGLLLAGAAAAAAAVLGPVMLIGSALLSGIGGALGVLAALTGPMGLLLAGLVAGGVLVARNWDAVSATFKGLWAGFKDGLSGLHPAIEALGDAFAPVVDAASTLWDWFTGLFAPVDGLAASADAVGASWGRAAGEMVSALAAPWLLDMADAVTMAWEMVPAVIASVGAAFADLRAFASPWLADMGRRIRAVWDRVPGAIVAVQQVLADLWVSAKEIAAGWSTGFARVFDGARWSALTAHIEPLMDAFRALGGALAGLWPEMEGADGTAMRFGETLGAIAGGALNTLADVIAMIATGITGLTQALAGLLSGDLSAVADGLLLAWDGVATFFENLSQTVTGMSLADAGRAILQGLADGIVGGLALATDAIGAVASGIMQKFKEWLGINSPSTVFAEFGGWIMDGLKDGLLAKLTAVTEAVGNIASTVAEKFKGWLGISSPSKVFAGFGGDVIAGLAVGMRANEGLAADRVAGLSRAVKAAAAGAVAGAVAGTPAMAVPELGAMTPPAPALMAPPVAPEFPARPPAPGAGPVNVTLQVTVQGDATRETVQDLEETLTRWVHSNGRMLTDVVGREAERRGRMDFGGG